jgi:hypothetical protein
MALTLVLSKYCADGLYLKLRKGAGVRISRGHTLVNVADIADAVFDAAWEKLGNRRVK